MCRVSSNPTRSNKKNHSSLVVWDLLVCMSCIPIVGQKGDAGNDRYEIDVDEENPRERVPAEQIDRSRENCGSRSPRHLGGKCRRVGSGRIVDCSVDWSGFKRKDTCSSAGLREGKMGVEVGRAMGNSSAGLVISPPNQYLA